MPRLRVPRKTRARKAVARQGTPALDAVLAAGHSAAGHSPRGAKIDETSLRAPITGEIEGQLEQLVTRFGYRKVRDALTPLINKCAFQDWLCVANAVDRLGRKARKRVTKRR
jgi:hypothetical protein